MDEQQPQSIQQVFDRMVAAILQRNDFTEPAEQRRELRRVVLDAAELAQFRITRLVDANRN
jgi:hypothetical protein